MSCVIDTVDQTYFLCCEEIYSAGSNNTIYNFGKTTVTGAQNSGAGAVIEAAFFCDTGDKTYNFQKAYCLPPDQGPFVDLNTLVSPDFEDQPAITIAQAAGNQIPDGDSVTTSAVDPATTRSSGRSATISSVARPATTPSRLQLAMTW